MVNTANADDDQNLLIVESGEIKEYIEGVGHYARQTKLKTIKESHCFNLLEFVTEQSNPKKY